MRLLVRKRSEEEWPEVMVRAWVRLRRSKSVVEMATRRRENQEEDCISWRQCPPPGTYSRIFHSIVT